MKVTPIEKYNPEEDKYQVGDYPYGFRLRCKIRYWIEFKKGFGFRFCSQTTNPKKTSETWNKPRTGTYSEVAGGLYLDENGHVQACMLSQFANRHDAIEFKGQFYECLGPIARQSLNTWIEVLSRREQTKENQL